MNLTKTQKIQYTNPAPAKSGVGIGVLNISQAINTRLKEFACFLLRSPFVMIGLVGVSLTRREPVNTVRQSCKSYHPKLAFSVVGFKKLFTGKQTMSNISILNFENQSITTTIDANGEIFFRASELTTALGFGNSRQAISTHVDKDDLQKLEISCDVQNLDGTSKARKTQKVNFVNESGMYALIFGSTKPEAKRFKKWVTSEVLPSIRKTGSYHTTKQNQELYQLCSGSLNYLMDYVKTLHNLNTVAHSDVLHNQKNFVVQQIHTIIQYCYANNITTPTGKPIFKNGELNFIGGNSVVYNLPMLRLTGLVNY